MQILKDGLRQRILNAAQEEFQTHGYKEASMRRIAAAAGITAGNIYRYYESKEALLQATIQPVMAAIETVIKDSSDGMIDWEFDADAFQDGRRLQLDLRHFAKGLVIIGSRYRAGMVFIAKDPTYRNRFKVWLTSVLFVYFSQNYADRGRFYNRIMASISADTLIDSVTEAMGFQEECQVNHVDISSIIYQCLSGMIQSEA